MNPSVMAFCATAHMNMNMVFLVCMYVFVCFGMWILVLVFMRNVLILLGLCSLVI